MSGFLRMSQWPATVQSCLFNEVARPDATFEGIFDESGFIATKNSALLERKDDLAVPAAASR